MISNLRLKFSERNWNETFLLVQRCTDKSRDESKPCKLQVKSLERIQEVFHAPSMNMTQSRLELTARQQGMGFHFTDATCYLTADLFYLEVVLLPSGDVQDVKVAIHGAPPLPSESLLHLLRTKSLASFSARLKNLFAQYDIPGDSETKLKRLESLRNLEGDLQKMSEEPQSFNSDTDLINIGNIGRLISGKHDFPLTVQFYTPPDDMKTPNSSVLQAAQITLSDSDVHHNFQLESSQLKSHGEEPLINFLLRLQPPVPILSSFVDEIDVTLTKVDLQWAPLHKLLMRGPCVTDKHQESENFTVVCFDDVTHTYVLPEGAWDAPGQRATVIDRIPFTHAAQIPALLQLLRHQCAINTLLRSCVAAHSAASASLTGVQSSSRLLEVCPESDRSVSVTFIQPHTDTLVVLLINMKSHSEVTCRVFGVAADTSLDEHIAAVTMRWMSIPTTMRALYDRLQETAASQISPNRPLPARAVEEISSLLSTDVGDAKTDVAAVTQSEAGAQENISLDE